MLLTMFLQNPVTIGCFIYLCIYSPFIVYPSPPHVSSTREGVVSVLFAAVSLVLF